MECQICNKKNGDYQCSVCKKIVCEKHHKTINGIVYCTQDLPKRPVMSSLRTAIYTVLILLAGVATITYIMNNYLVSMPLFTDVIPITTGLTAFANLISISLGTLLVILIIAYAILSRKYK